MSKIEKFKTKPWHQHFETIGSITAIVVGVAALYVSSDQSRVMREEVRASVWPALQVDRIFSINEGSLVMGLRVQNAGVGPALVRRVTVRHDGEHIDSPEKLAARLPPYDSLTHQGIRGRIIAAGDTLRAFEISYRDTEGFDGSELVAEVSETWQIDVCYCSTLGECWVSDEASSVPRPVKACDDKPASEF